MRARILQKIVDLAYIYKTSFSRLTVFYYHFNIDEVRLFSVTTDNYCMLYYKSSKLQSNESLYVLN